MGFCSPCGPGCWPRRCRSARSSRRWPPTKQSLMPSRDDPDLDSSDHLTAFRRGPESCRKTFGWRLETGNGSAKVRLTVASSERPEEVCAIRWKFCSLLLSGLSSGGMEKRKCRGLRAVIVEATAATVPPSLRSSIRALPCLTECRRGGGITGAGGGHPIRETVEDLEDINFITLMNECVEERNIKGNLHNLQKC